MRLLLRRLAYLLIVLSIAGFVIGLFTPFPGHLYSCGVLFVVGLALYVITMPANEI